MTRRNSDDRSVLEGPRESESIYLLDAGSEFEQRMLERWVQSQVRPSARTIRLTSSRRGRKGETGELTAVLESTSDPYLIPLRVVWLAPEKDGNRSVGWSDALKPGDPRDPKGLRARLIRILRPGRVKLTAAEGAHASELTADYKASEGVEGLADYVTRRAWRALDRAERRLHGNRYKIPRFVPEAILARREFIDAVEQFAEARGEPRDRAIARAERYLREIAATHSPYVIDLIANAIHSLYKQGYSEIKYDDNEVARVAELSGDHPIVYLPSHRSNLDRLSLQFMLWENDLPPNHTAGGINLDFFPIGPLIRRTGVFFIRRSFKENELYKLVLRSYIDYLVEKRFPLEWYMEGGRSRSGRLNSPRFGLLAYVVDALRRGKSEDIMLIPVSIAYDQIQDVPDYALEAQGKSKETESLGWLLKAIRSLRRRYGDIHIRFGEPISVRSVLATIDDTDEEPIGLQKLAFEVMYRIGRVTPITPTAIVSIVLLAARGKALTASKYNIAQFETQKAQLEARNLDTRTEAEDLASRLDGQTFIVIRSASDSGALYGSVTPRDAAEVASEGGFSVERKQITSLRPIKELGLHEMNVRLHPEVAATIVLNVARSAEEAVLQAEGKSIQELAAEEEAAAEFEIAELFDDMGAAAAEDFGSDDDQGPSKDAAPEAEPAAES